MARRRPSLKELAGGAGPRLKPELSTSGNGYAGDHVHGNVEYKDPEFVPGDAYEGPLPVAPAAGAAPRRGRDWSKLFITSAAFAERDTRPNWLVKQVLVWDQPAVIAGPQKVLKTSFLVDLVISLASATPFLGRFEIGGPTKCAMLSGESGDDTLKRTAERVCGSKGIEFASIADRVVWCFEVPALTDPDDLGSLVDYLAAQGVKVAVIDPLYLSLLAGKGDGPDARSLYEMGSTFRRVALEFKAAGITPILAHHANRRVEANEPMELQHLAFSGIGEFSRQWLLLSRRRKYEGDGRHELWVSIGGSAGQSGLYVADVAEGKINDDFSGRTWDVTVKTAAEARSEGVVDQSAKQDEKARLQRMKDEQDILAAIDAEVEAGRPGASKKAIRNRFPRLNNNKIDEIADRLIDRLAIEAIQFISVGGNGSEQEVSGFRKVNR